MAFYLHLKPNDLEAAPSSRSLCSRRITKEYDLQLLVIFMVCSLRSNWRYILYPNGLHAKIFALVVAENMARKLFAFGVGSEKITRHNEKIPVPLLGKTQTAILAFWVRVFE
uniref:hypothetical protein n=1 Tax=Porphyromonas gingivalis TaxID=837 RepID=UPI003FA05435